MYLGFKKNVMDPLPLNIIIKKLGQVDVIIFLLLLLRRSLYYMMQLFVFLIGLYLTEYPKLHMV